MKLIYFSFIVVAMISQASFATSIPSSLQRLFDAVDRCGGNASGSISTYEVNRFDADNALKTLKAQDSRRGCLQDHAYSTSRQDAVKRMQHTLTKETIVRECIEDNVSKAHQRELQVLMTNPNNLGVFASVPSKEMTNPEGCTYFSYALYMPEGVRIQFIFDFTD